MLIVVAGWDGNNAQGETRGRGRGTEDSLHGSQARRRDLSAESRRTSICSGKSSFSDMLSAWLAQAIRVTAGCGVLAIKVLTPSCDVPNAQICRSFSGAARRLKSRRAE
jgi:hypothetical protein